MGTTTRALTLALFLLGSHVIAGKVAAKLLFSLLTLLLLLLLLLLAFDYPHRQGYLFVIFVEYI